MDSGWANAARAMAAAGSRQVPSFRGKTRLMRACDRMLRRWAASPHPFAVDIDGVKFVVDTTDLNDFKIMYGVDADVADYLARVIDARDLVVWDVGANVGAIALSLAARCPQARIVAIEASPSVGRRLERNLTANPKLAHRIQYLPVALSDACGETAFYESAETFNSGVGRLQPAGNTSSAASPVLAWSGDALIERGLAPAPDVVKIDIEGFEYQALRGMAAFLARAQCHVIFEHEPYRLDSPNNPPSPVAWLRELGYRIWTMEGARLGGPIGEQLPSHHCDLVAIK